jgi:hypothetical protein
LRIPFVEGNNADHAHLNRKIGHVGIDAAKVIRDLPMGSNVEIRLEIDSSRLLRGSVYIDVLDQEFPIRVEGLIKPQPELQELRKEFSDLQQRLEAAKETATEAQDTHVPDLDKIRQEDTFGEVSRLLAAGDDPETTRTCELRLLELKVALQRVEDAIEAPKLATEAKQEIQWTEEALRGATAEEQKQFALLRPELESAMHGDTETLRRKVEQMWNLRIRILARAPDYWIGYRNYLLERKAEMSDQAQAKLWFSHADRAINSGDLDSLKTACRQLMALLPQQVQTRGYGGGTVRARN